MDDRDIIELYWSRDEQAIHQTQQRYGAYCHAIAFRITGSQEDADECVSDTWLRAWNSIPPQRPNGLGTFLGRITRNLAIDRRRTEQAEKRGGGEFTAVWEELEGCLSGGPDPEKTLEGKELTGLIEEFLQSLPAAERRVFVRRYWHFLTVSEIAWQYGYSAAKTRTMLYRTRKKLRTYLMKRGVLE